MTKMQSDSAQFVSSEPNKEACKFAAQPTVKSFQCDKCTLVFKSKVYLFEHLNNVHDLDVHTALQVAGLKYAEADKNSSLEKKHFKCQHCDFKTCHQDLFKKHKKQCHQNENANSTEASSGSENHEAAGVSADRHTEAAELEEIPSVLSAASTPETKSLLASLKDLKTYKRPPQTNENLFKNPPELNGTPCSEEEDDPKETLILQETPLASRPNSSGVSRATVKSVIDVTVRGCSELLLTDHLSVGLLPNHPKTQLTEPGQCHVGKRTNNKSLQSPPAKKAKLLPEAELSQIENAHPSSSPEFSFEVSEDEEEQKVNQAHKDPQSPDVYFCKHCDFREGDFNLMSLHYQNDHPYVRCNAAYVNNSNDQSATFRCLECPFEFASAVDLKWHYTEKHPAAPDVFKLKSSELCLLFKCFQCNFTCDALKPLRQHYKESHPAYSVDNSLLFCRYSVPKSSQDDESCKLQKHEISACPEQLIERSPERESTLGTEVQETPSPQRPTPTRLDVHTCQICSFAHKSVVVMHVHYKKHHPEEANSIARLRQLASSPSHLPQQTPQKEFLKKEDPELTKQKRVLSMQVEEAEALTFMYRTSKEPLGSHQGEAQPQADAESTEGSQAKMKMKEVDAKDLATTKANAYGDAENLFYCETCNYGNPSIKGIQNHQIKIHRHTINNECVAEYTSMICDQIKKSKAANKGSSSAHHLPLPVLNSGDENMFFCPICNYRHDTIQKVMRHHSARHGVFYMKSALIDQYTSVVLKQTKKPTPEIEIKKKEEDKKKVDTHSSDSPSAKVPQTERVLQCYRCDFHTPIVYLLKKHLLKVHNVNRAYKDIIQLCYRAGSLTSGYHCEWCVFSDKTTVAVFEHYREQHPLKQINYPYINTKLYAGPKILQTHKKKPKLVPPVETTIYSTSEKKRSDEQRNEKPSSSNQMEDLSKIPGLFESFQVPLDETDDKPLSTSQEFKCPSCPQSFRSQRNLSAHCRTEHKDVVDDSTEMSKSQTQAAMCLQVHVFKCVHCPYINTMYQGVLTHSQMKHPTLIPEMDTLLLDVKHLRNWEEYTKKKECGETPKVYGYICEKCQRIFVTLKKLKRHCSTTHQSGESNPVQDEEASSAKPHGNKGSVSMASFLSKKKYGKIRCQHCSYICSSKMALSQHLHIHHKSFAPKGSFKCSLCSHVFYHKKRLKCHYIKEHDKSAYLKYYLPLCKKYNNESEETSMDSSSAQQPKTDSTEGRKVFLKCPVCPYFNTRHHGTLTHCQMKHPDVFVRANELETQEILQSELSGCLIGKNSSQGGYMCDECGGILKSFKKFKTHCQRHHKGEKVSRPPQDVEVERTPTKLPTVLAKKSPSPAKVTEAASSLSDLESSPSKASPMEVQRAYKCQLCSHETTCRKYLRSHYQNTHKLDGITTYKYLEKYNRRKRSYLSLCGVSEKHKYVRGEEIITVKCQQCPDLVLDSHQLLIEHYSHFHGLGSKLDFKVLSFGVRKGSTGIYKCSHCLTKLYGTRKLHYHLDRHRAKMVELTKALLKKQPAVDPVASGTQQDELSPFENVAELGQRKISSVAPSSPVNGASIKVDAEAENDGHACKQCGRTFMSLSGLHSHEQSHAALAAIEKLDHLSTSGEKLKMNKYVIHKSGTVKPFRCSCCSYRTTLLGLLRRHFLKNHQDVVQRDMTKGHSGEHLSPTAGKTPPYQINAFLDPDLELEESEESVYSEPPDVQRQLNHYSLMARNNSEPSDGHSALKLAKNRQLCCEFCNFHTEHPSSIRRHYMSRHGKKILRCKDCSFFTGLRKSLEMHIEAGHLTFQPTATYQKDFRCPFCLYQSKNKNHMIDHIVLHREERVVPIEVHRPKLSRYLQGIVFRCHRCTFTCGSANSLHFHMMRHSDLKPYKCRLCYFDCALLKDLEKHLSDQHQVLRNHELVGQVSLDQLESRMERRKEKEPDIQGLQDFDGDCADFSEAENMTHDDTEKKTILRELLEKRDEDGNGQNSAKSCTNLQCPKSGLQEQDLQSGALIHSTGGLQAASGDQRAEVQQDDCSDPRKPNQDNLHHSTFNADAEMKEDMANVLSTIKVEEDLQDDAVDLKLNKEDGIVPAPNDQVNTSLANTSSAEDTKDSSSPNPPPQTASPIDTDTSSVSLKTCKDELEQTSINSQEAPEHFGEMPVLENELLKKKLDSPENCKEQEEENEGGRMVSDDSGTSDKKEDISPVDKAVGVLNPPRFQCEFCGRSFTNLSELTHHVGRHGR